MKQTILSVIITFFAISTFGQQYVCRNDTVHFYQTNYRGKLVWQRSDNGTDWSMIPGAGTDTINVAGTFPAYYRTEVTEGACRPLYSDAIHLLINELPAVSLNLADSVCMNQTPFILSGGLPEGGVYHGTGVIDGKFSPSVAGAGKHKIYYRYFDLLTGCSDSTHAYLTVTGLPNQAQAGTDLTMIFADSVMVNANKPENGTGTWEVVNGSYGHFSDIHAPKAWFYKDSMNLDFILRWTVSGRCGASSDDLAVSFFPISKNPCPNAPVVTDADGNIYPTVRIGEQCWMAKNLNVGRRVSSTVSNMEHSNLSDNNIVEKYCYENKPENCNIYGGLYDWNEAMGYTQAENAQGICPDGWHIPGNNDWATLNNLFGYGDAGKQMKVGGSTGFEGLFAGDRNATGEFYSLDAGGFWWQSTSYIYLQYNEGHLRQIEACNGNLTRTYFPKKTGLSVRCIKNKQ